MRSIMMACGCVGVITDDHDALSTGEWPLCEEEGKHELPPCPKELVVRPAGKVKLYLNINSLKGELTCKDYVTRAGLVVGVSTVDEQVSRMATTTSVPYSNDCQKPTRP